MRSAKEAFESGDFGKAATLLNEASALAPTPATIYNLGRARERAGDLTGAIVAYRRYLDVSPGSTDRGAVEATILELERRGDEQRRLKALEQAQPPPPTAAAPSPPAAPAAAARRTAVGPWLVGGGGLIGFGVAVGLGVTATSTHRMAARAVFIDEAVANQRQAESLAIASSGTYVAAGVLLSTAVIWLIIEALSHAP